MSAKSGVQRALAIPTDISDDLELGRLKPEFSLSYRAGMAAAKTFYPLTHTGSRVRDDVASVALQKFSDSAQ